MYAINTKPQNARPEESVSAGPTFKTYAEARAYIDSLPRDVARTVFITELA